MTHLHIKFFHFLKLQEVFRDEAGGKDLVEKEEKKSPNSLREPELS
jgi:hypothetical protein